MNKIITSREKFNYWHLVRVVVKWPPCQGPLYSSLRTTKRLLSWTVGSSAIYRLCCIMKKKQWLYSYSFPHSLFLLSQYLQNCILLYLQYILGKSKVVLQVVVVCISTKCFFYYSWSCNKSYNFLVLYYRSFVFIVYPLDGNQSWFIIGANTLLSFTAAFLIFLFICFIIQWLHVLIMSVCLHGFLYSVLQPCNISNDPMSSSIMPDYLIIFTCFMFIPA